MCLPVDNKATRTGMSLAPRRVMWPIQNTRQRIIGDCVTVDRQQWRDGHCLATQLGRCTSFRRSRSTFDLPHVLIGPNRKRKWNAKLKTPVILNVHNAICYFSLMTNHAGFNEDIGNSLGFLPNFSLTVK